MTEYELDIMDIHGVKRLENLIKNYYQIMETLNEDSRESVDGGASMYYKVKISFMEKWS